MHKNEKQTVSIVLETAEEFFLEPVYNPFDPESRSQAGIDELVDQVRKLSTKEPLKICLTLSSRPADADIEDRVKKCPESLLLGQNPCV